MGLADEVVLVVVACTGVFCDAASFVGKFDRGLGTGGITPWVDVVAEYAIAELIDVGGSGTSGLVLVQASTCFGAGWVTGGVFSRDWVRGGETPLPGGIEGLRVTLVLRRSLLIIDSPSGTYGFGGGDVTALLLSGTEVDGGALIQISWGGGTWTCLRGVDIC